VADLEIRFEPTRRQLLRAHRQELLWLGWAVAAVTSAVVIFVVFDHLGARVAMALGIAWCVFQGRQALRRILLKHRILTSGIPTLRLSDLGVQVRNLFGHLDGAALAWVDCAAVVVSRVPKDPTAWVPATRYVRFVPVAPDRVEGTARKPDSRPGLLDLTPQESLTVWLELAGQRPGADEVVAWLRVHRAGLRLVGARNLSAQSSEE
jgi:hypothetical protein